MVCLTFLFLGRDANKMKEEYIDLENQWKLGEKIKKTGKVRSCSLLLCTQLTCRSILFSNVHQKRADVTLVALREVLGSGCLQQGSGTNKRSHEEVEGSKVTVATALSNVPLRPELTIICFTIILHEEGGDRGEQESKPTQNQTYLYLLAKLVNHFLFCCTPIIRRRQQRIRYSSSTTFIFDTFYEPESNDLFLLPSVIAEEEDCRKDGACDEGILRLESHLAFFLLRLRICDLYCFFLLEEDALKQKGACDEVTI